MTKGFQQVWPQQHFANVFLSLGFFFGALVAHVRKRSIAQVWVPREGPALPKIIFPHCEFWHWLAPVIVFSRAPNNTSAHRCKVRAQSPVCLYDYFSESICHIFPICRISTHPSVHPSSRPSIQRKRVASALINVRRKFRSQTSDNMDKCKSRSGKSQRREKKKEHQRRGKSQQKEDEGAQKVEKPRARSHLER